MKLSILILCLVVFDANAQTFGTACGSRYSTAVASLTFGTAPQDCLYLLDNSQVSVTGTSQTLSSTETVMFAVPTASGAQTGSQTNVAFTNFYKMARTIMTYKSTGSSASSLALSYNPTVATGTTETTLSTNATCGGIISSTSGQITQPSGSTTMTCFWVFSSPSNATVTIAVTDVVATGGACATDYLQINKFGPSNDRTSMTYCSGSTTAATFTANSSTVIQYAAGSSGSSTLTFKLTYNITIPTSGVGALYNSWAALKMLASVTGLLFLGKTIQL